MKSFGARCAIVLVSFTVCAHGQPRDPGGAERAFDEAERLLAEGQVAEACARYTESHRMDPQLGALLHVADCNERLGRYASAWKAFAEGERLAVEKRDARAQVARERAEKLASRVSFLRVVAPQEPPPGLEVRLDGAVLDARALSEKIALNPGSHFVVATAPGRRPFQTALPVEGGGGVLDVAIPVLATEPVGMAPAATDPAADAGGGAKPGEVQRIAGFVGLGLGAVGLGVGGYFFLTQSAKASDAEKLDSKYNADCPADALVPTAQCLETSKYTTDTNQKLAGLEKDQHAARTGGIVATAIGGGLIAAGVVLLLTAPSAPSEQALIFVPEAGLGRAALTLRGRF